MADSSRFLMVWPLLLATLLPMLYNNFFPLLNQYAGRVPVVNPGFAHVGHGAKNNAGCKSFPEGKACEDVRIHHESGTAFLACGFPETRNHFFPPLNRLDKTSAETYREYFLKYDIEGNSVTRLRIVGWEGDLVLHGLDVKQGADSSTVYIFAVNHDRKGESILRFAHVLGTHTLTFEREFSHSLIKTPNAVMADTPNSFYISNDHYFYPGFLFGIPRKLEDLLGPFRWETGIVYCDASDAKIQCKEVSPNGHHPHANGILLADDGKTLMVNDVIDGSTTIYDIDSSSKLLTVRKKVKLGAAADNLSFIPGTGDIAVCVFPHIGHLIHKLSGENVLNSSVTASAAVLRLVKSKEYEPEVLFWDDGSQISGLTGAAVDPKRKKLIAGGVYEQHFVVCDLGNEQF